MREGAAHGNGPFINEQSGAGAGTLWGKVRDSVGANWGGHSALGRIAS